MTDTEEHGGEKDTAPLDQKFKDEDLLFKR